MKDIAIELPTHEEMAKMILSDGIDKTSTSHIVAVIGWLEKEYEKRCVYDTSKDLDMWQILSNTANRVRKDGINGTDSAVLKLLLSEIIKELTTRDKAYEITINPQ